MAEKVIVKAEVRKDRGKNDARRLRAAGRVPLIVYGGGAETVAASASIKDLAAILRSDSGQNTVFSLDVADADTSDVMFHDRQIDPLKGRLVHVDLRRLTKGEKIEVTVPIHLIGEAIGLKEEGAILNQQLREIKVLCEPSKIPEFLEIDVENLEMNESVHVSDLKVGEGIEIHETPETVVASIVLVKEEDLEPAPETDAAEPELVGDKTEEDTSETE
ncbi:MAG: 50S ribosomal protein L25 [Acidobacteriota bacterium]|jgi:large subunit ribosomal protein L25|nr:50S ribosomal protein L25 [Acidobacteriota bacterium]